MTNNILSQAFRDSGILDVLAPPDQLRHNAAIRDTIDPAGRIASNAAERFRTYEKEAWSTIDGRPKRTAQSGTLILLWAHANTAPSSGPCIVQFTLETLNQGASAFVEVRIEQGRRIGEAVLAQPVPAGAYLNPTVTSAGGASAVSAGLVIKV